MTRFEFQVPESFHRSRLDDFLFNEFDSMSKAYLRRVVKEGNCEVNGYVENTGKLVKASDFVEIDVDVDQEKGMAQEEIPLDIIYEDGDLLVVNKPTGMLVHPTNYERNGTLLNGLTYHLNRDRGSGDKFVRPHLIHRLDRETSGLMVIATNQRASRILCSHFKRKLFEKKYVALVEGRLKEESGEIDAPIDRDADRKIWRVMNEGKESLTKFRVLERSGTRTLLELEPVTGRTNQLRIHCAHAGHPILGDEMHGDGRDRRLFLHASRLAFWHPGGGTKLSFSSDPEFSIEKS